MIFINRAKYIYQIWTTELKLLARMNYKTYKNHKIWLFLLCTDWMFAVNCWKTRLKYSYITVTEQLSNINSLMKQSALEPFRATIVKEYTFNSVIFRVSQYLWLNLKKPGFHTHNIKLTFSPEMDYWLNTLSYSTAGLVPKSQVWFLWQLFLDPV